MDKLAVTLPALQDEIQAPKKLFNRNFFLLWQGQTVSRIGNHIFSVAMVLWLIDFTDKASLIGLMGMLAGIPGILLPPIGGAVADRLSRRNIIVICDLLNGILIMLLSGVFFLYSHDISFVIASLMTVTFLSAAINSFFFPAISASIPDIVPEDRLNAANSFSQSSAQIITIFGQIIGGSLYLFLGAPLLILFNGSSFLFSSLSEVFIKIPQKHLPDKTEPPKKMKLDLSEGLRYIWQRKGLRNLAIISALLNFFTIPVFLLFPYFLEKVLLINKAWYPYFLAVYALGNILGFIIAGLKPGKSQFRNRLIFIFIITDAAAYGVIGFVANIYFALLIILLSGLMGGYIQVIITSIMQSTTPSELRGRVFGFLGTLGASLAPLAMGLAGVVADLTNKNIPLIYSTCSLIMLALSLYVFADRDIHEFLNYRSDQTGPMKQAFRNSTSN